MTCQHRAVAREQSGDAWACEECSVYFVLEDEFSAVCSALYAAEDALPVHYVVDAEHGLAEQITAWAGMLNDKLVEARKRAGNQAKTLRAQRKQLEYNEAVGDLRRQLDERDDPDRRTYLAGQALAGMLAAERPDDQREYGEHAEHAVGYADATIAALDAEVKP